MPASPLRPAGKALFVESTCVDCTLCRSIAPAHFEYDPVHGQSVPSRNPQTADEVAECEWAALNCPVGAIKLVEAAVSAQSTGESQAPAA